MYVWPTTGTSSPTIDIAQIRRRAVLASVGLILCASIGPYVLNKVAANLERQHFFRPTLSANGASIFYQELLLRVTLLNFVVPLALVGGFWLASRCLLRGSLVQAWITVAGLEVLVFVVTLCATDIVAAAQRQLGPYQSVQQQSSTGQLQLPVVESIHDMPVSLAVLILGALVVSVVTVCLALTYTPWRTFRALSSQMPARSRATVLNSARAYGVVSGLILVNYALQPLSFSLLSSLHMPDSPQLRLEVDFLTASIVLPVVIVSIYAAVNIWRSIEETMLRTGLLSQEPLRRAELLSDSAASFVITPIADEPAD